MTVNFATPFAHQTGGNYASFNNAVVVGRPFRQPLIAAPNPGNFSSGLELFFSSVGDVANVYSWFDGTLTWEAATVASPGHRLHLETHPLVLRKPGAATSLSSLSTLEARPQKAIYENLDQPAVQAALETLLTDAYNAAVAAPGNTSRWHPSMNMRVQDAGVNRSLKEYIDNHAPAATAITNLVNAFLNAPAVALITKIQIRAGQQLGRAAGYLAGDILPVASPFPLGGAGDPNRARRLTFRVIDLGKQTLNPVYYLYHYMNQMLLPIANRVVLSLTNIVNAGALRHPLVDLFPAITAAQPPTAREQVDGHYAFAIGELGDWHSYPEGAPVSTLEWRYSNVGVFEAQARIAGTVVPNLAPTVAATNKVNALWNPAAPAVGYGVAICAICEALQVPAELIAALIGSEALQNLDPRAVRLEPLRDIERERLDAGGVAAADVLAFDQAVGIQGNATAVALNANNTSRLDITLVANRTWRANVLLQRRWQLLVGDTDRLKIRANAAGINTVNYQITVRDRLMSGGFGNNGTQNHGTTLFYFPTSRGNGQAVVGAAQFTLQRSGTLRRLQVTASHNTLDGNTTVTVVRNGAATGISVVLAAGARVGNDNAHTVVAANGDNISIQVTTTGTMGNIRNLRTELYHAPDTGNVRVLEGHSTSVPVPWNGAAAVRAGHALTWNQLVTIVDVPNGSRVSPGLLQTLISTAREQIPFVNSVAPNIFATLGIPVPPATAGDMLNEWLLTGVHSLVLGAAYIRRGYNGNGTSYDLPLVGAAYNAGSLVPTNNSRWGLRYFGDYVEHAAPHFNASVNIFNGAPVPAPTVRFVR